MITASPKTSSGLKKAIKISLLLLAMLIFAYGLGLAHKYRLIGRAWFNLQAIVHAEEWSRDSLGLSDYRAVIQAKPVKEAAGLSGLTYDPDTGSLFAVSDHGGYILELSLAGEVIRKIGLEDFPDAEAIEYIGDNQYLIADETDQSVSLVAFDEHSPHLSAQDIRAKISLGMEFSKNRSFEGLAYDPEEQTIYIAKEHKPIRLYLIKGLIRKAEEPLILHINNVPACEKRLFRSMVPLKLLNRHSRIEMWRGGSLAPFLHLDST